MANALSKYTVIYVEAREGDHDPVRYFPCDAEDADHATEQCENAYPGCTVYFTAETDNPEIAYGEWAYTNERYYEMMGE